MPGMRACERFRFPEIFVQRQSSTSTKKDNIPVKSVLSKTNDQFAGEKSQKDSESLASTCVDLPEGIIFNELLS